MTVKEILERYHQALEKDPDSLVDLLSLGNVNKVLNRLELAEQYYRHALVVDPFCPEAALSLAEILFEEKKMIKEAYQILDTALQKRNQWRFYRLLKGQRKLFDEQLEDLYNYLEDQLISPPVLHLPFSSKKTVNISTGLSQKTAAREDLNPPPSPVKNPPRVGRNDPCPCGSGKKYKKCCLLKDEER